MCLYYVLYFVPACRPRRTSALLCSISRPFFVCLSVSRPKQQDLIVLPLAFSHLGATTVNRQRGSPEEVSWSIQKRERDPLSIDLSNSISRSRSRLSFHLVSALAASTFRHLNDQTIKLNGNRAILRLETESTAASISRGQVSSNTSSKTYRSAGGGNICHQ